MKIKLVITISLLLLSGVILNRAVAASQESFSDVSSSHPNFEAIEELKKRNIISGYSDGTYRPRQIVKRVEALKIILYGSGIDVPEATGNAGLLDIQKDWYTKFVLKAVASGIVQGYPDKTFKPTQSVNLVESLKMLILTNKIDLASTLVTEKPYQDSDIDQWYAKYVQYAKDNNLIDADAHGKVYPAEGVNRGKLAEMVYRLIKMKEQGSKQFDEPSLPPAIEEDYILNVMIENSTFKKSEMTVGRGTTVKWTNKDGLPHTVTAEKGSFDSGNMDKEGTFKYTFAEDGTYSYYCKYHPGMKGTIIVKDPILVPTI